MRRAVASMLAVSETVPWMPSRGIVNLLDFPFPGHRAPRENARKSGVSILLCSLFLVGFRSS